MNLISSSKSTEKKSKFFAFLYGVNNEEEIISILTSLKKSHAKASHICYAFVVAGEEKFKNDGEVGYPAKALLAILKEKKKTSHLLVVIRYFGGINLGPGGVSRAFRSVGRSCMLVDV